MSFRQRGTKYAYVTIGNNLETGRMLAREVCLFVQVQFIFYVHNVCIYA